MRGQPAGAARGTRWHHAITRSGREGVRFADGIGALGILFLIAFVASGLTRDQMAEFLQARVTMRNVLVLGVLVTTWPLAFSLAGLYNANPRWSRGHYHLLRVPLATTVGAAVLLLFPLTRQASSFGYKGVVVFWLASTAWSILLRVVTTAVSSFTPNTPARRVLIVGTGPRAERVVDQLYNDARFGTFELVGFVDALDFGRRTRAAKRLLGSVEDLDKILMREAVDEVFIALPVRSCYCAIEMALQTCERVGVQSKHLADVFESTYARPRIETSGEQPVVTMKVVHDDARVLIKRGLDIVGAATGLVVLLPIFAAIAIAIRSTSAGPVIFSQERYGYRRRRFRMYKFRTMVPDAERMLERLEHRNEATGAAFKIRDDPRVTRVGRVLRRTSLDELPQLWNILLGHMSIVGPRPMSVRDVSRFDESWLMRRFSVRPGLTGLWQVSGRSNLTFEQWMQLDLTYIDSWSLALDLSIIARTFPAVALGVGAT